MNLFVPYGFRQAIRIIFDICPFDKAVYGSDGFIVPEGHWLGAKVSNEELVLLFATYVEDGLFDQDYPWAAAGLSPFVRLSSRRRLLSFGGTQWFRKCRLGTRGSANSGNSPVILLLTSPEEVFRISIHYPPSLGGRFVLLDPVVVFGVQQDLPNPHLNTELLTRT